MSENTPEKTFDKNSIQNTFLTATVVCLVCSFLVAGLHVMLKSMQDRNKALDIKANIVRVAGFMERDIEKAGGIEACFHTGDEAPTGKRIYDVLIDLETGSPEKGLEIARSMMGDGGADADEATVIAAYDAARALIATDKDSEGDLMFHRELDKDSDIASLKKVERVAHIYMLKDKDGNVEKYIFPVRGKGLWSVLKGFMAVEPDLQTIAGLTYYEHGETPGLGGEVDNPDWKKQWTLNEDKPKKNKQIFDDGGKVKIKVVKGKASSPFEVDGLAGATITSNGVSNMLDFWLGDNGFGPFIKNQSGAAAAKQSAANSPSKGATDG